MAEAKRKADGNDDALLRRLQRLTARAGTVEANDRAQLLALLDDIDRVRRELLRECARLDEEIQRAAIRVTAVTAYARGAKSIRGPHRGGR
jgi:hypothetical protein